MIPTIFVQNVSKMYKNISNKNHRIPESKSCVITKVHDLLGQPSYMHGNMRFLIVKINAFPCILNGACIAVSLLRYRN